MACVCRFALSVLKHCQKRNLQPITEQLSRLRDQPRIVLDFLKPTGNTKSICQLAQVACMRDAVCKHKHYSLKVRGKTHGQALRYIGDRLLKVLCSMLENNTLYEAKPPEIDTAA